MHQADKVRRLFLIKISLELVGLIVEIVTGGRHGVVTACRHFFNSELLGGLSAMLAMNSMVLHLAAAINKFE